MANNDWALDAPLKSDWVPDKKDGIINKISGAGEAALSVLSGGVSWIPAGIVKASGLASGQLKEGSELGDVVQKALTYEPRTEIGKTLAGYVALPFEKLSEGAQEAGDWVFDKTGSPFLGAATKTAIESIPFVAPPVIIKGVKAARGARRITKAGEDIAKEVKLSDWVLDKEQSRSTDLMPDQNKEAPNVSRQEKMQTETTVIEEQKGELLNAVKEGEIKERNQPERSGINENRATTETGSGDIIEQGGKVQEVQAETPINAEIETKPAKAAVDINKQLVEQGFNELPDYELAQYTPKSKEVTLQRVSDILSEDYGKAYNMALGKETIPPDVSRQVLYNAVKLDAYAKGDVQAIMELAKSPIATERSLLAQKLGESGFNNSVIVDPVKDIQDISKTRTETAQRTGKKVASEEEIAKLTKQAEETQSVLELHEVNKSIDRLIRAKDVRSIVEEAQNSSPVFQAIDQAKKSGGINYKSLIDTFGKEETAQFAKKNPGLVSKTGGAKMDVLAADFGFESDVALKDAIMDKQSKKSMGNDLQKQFNNKYADDIKLAKKGFEKTDGIYPETLDVGDQVYMKNDFYKVKGFDEDGKVILKDGNTLKVDPFEKLDAQGIKRASQDVEAAPKKSRVKYGSQNKIVTDLDYEATKAELRKQFGSQLSAGLDPTIAAKLGKIGVYHLEAGIREFGAWSKQIIVDVGEWAKPHLEEIYKAAQDTLDKETVSSISAKISKSLEGGKDFAEVGRYVQNLAKHYVSKGITDRNKLVEAVHASLKEIMPDITIRETADAISGYGKFKQLSKEEVSVKLRDIKGQLQQVSKLEDLQSKKPPLKTGMERRTPSDTERVLIKQVEEAKKKYGIQAVDKETQLKSSLDAIKTRLKNQIVDLGKQIEERKKIVKDKSSVAYDKEANALKAKRDKLKADFDKIFAEPTKSASQKHDIAKKNRLKKQIETLEKQIAAREKTVKDKMATVVDKETYDLQIKLDSLKSVADNIFGNKELTTEQRVNAAIKAVEKSINEYNKKISNKDISPLTKKRAPLENEKLNKLQAERTELRKQLKELRDAANPKKTPDQIALQSLKSRLKNEAKKATEKLDNLDLAKAEKRNVPKDAEYEKLKLVRDQARENLKAAADASGTITKEEAAKIVELSKNVSDAKAKMEQGGDRFEYGAAKVAYQNFVESLKNPERTISKMAKDRAAEFKTSFKENRVKAILDLAKDAAVEIDNNSIALVASADNSFIGRQGLKTLQTHPTIWANAAKKSFSDIYKALREKHGAEKAKDILHADLVSRENYLNGYYQKAGILAKFEEQYPTSHPARAPYIGRTFKASEVAFTNTALRMRVDTFDLLLDIAKKNGAEINDIQIKAIGDVVNSATARAHIGEARVTSLVLWAPRMMWANVNVLTAHFGGAGLKTSFARQQARINLMKIVASTATVAAVLNALDPGSTEINPLSTDFMKYKKGNTRIDLTGGSGSYITLVARMLTQQTKNAQTKIIKDLNTGKYGDTSVFSVGIDFLANKTTPLVRQGIYWSKGKNFEGKKPTLASTATDLVTPIPVKNFIENFLGDYPENTPIAIFGSMVDVVGVNANTYQNLSQWEDKGTKEIERFRRRVGEERFKEANVRYNKAVNAKIDEVVKSVRYQSMNSDDQKKVIEGIRRREKQKIIH